MSQLPASIPFIVCDDLTVRKSGNLTGRMVGQPTSRPTSMSQRTT